MGSSRNNRYITLSVEGNPLSNKSIDTDIKVNTERLLIKFDPKIIKIGTDFADIKVSQENTETAI